MSDLNKEYVQYKKDKFKFEQEVEKATALYEADIEKAKQKFEIKKQQAEEKMNRYKSSLKIFQKLENLEKEFSNQTEKEEEWVDDRESDF